MQRTINENTILLSNKYILFAILINLPVRYLVQHASDLFLPAVALFSLIIFLIIGAYFFKKYKYIYFFFLLGIGIPSDVFRYLLMAIAIVILGLSEKRRISYQSRDVAKLSKVFTFLVIYLCFISLVNIGNNSDIWCFPLYMITFLSYPLCIFLLLRINFSDADVLYMQKALMTIIFSHIAAVLLYPLLLGNPSDYLSVVGSIISFAVTLGIPFPGQDYPWGDWHMSALASSNNVGMVSAIFAFFCLYCALFTKKKKYFIWMAISFFVYIMTDTKHTYPVTIIGLFLLLWKVRLIAKKWWINLLLFSGTFVLFIISLINIISIGSSLRTLNKTYTEDIQNYKLELILRSIQLIKENPLSFLIGQSSGTYGSRVASARAADILAKKEIKLPNFIPNYTSSNYRWAMKGLYLEEFLVKSKSGAMQNPFASIIGIIMEMGLIGSCMFFYLLYSTYQYCQKYSKTSASPIWKAYAFTVMFAILYIIWASVFDQYFEMPVPAMFFWSFMAIFLLKYRNHKQAEAIKSVNMPENIPAYSVFDKKIK